MLNMLQKGLSWANSQRTSNNPLVSASLSIGSRLVQNNAPNIASAYNTIANTYNSVMSNLDTMGKYFSQGTVSLENDLINRMAEINWARGYQWDVYIDEAPKGDFSPNSFGLPVFDIKETCAEVGDSYNLNAANTDYQFPLRKKLFDIQLTMFDNEKCDMEQYFEAWITKVYPWDGVNSGYTQFLSESVRTLYVRKLDSMKRVIFERKYLVYPEIQLTGINNSESAIRTLTIPLVVAGFLGKEQMADTGTGLASKKETGGNVFTDIKDNVQGVLTGEINLGNLIDSGKDRLRQGVQSVKQNGLIASVKSGASKVYKGTKEFYNANKGALQQVAANQLRNKAKKYL